MASLAPGLGAARLRAIAPSTAVLDRVYAAVIVIAAVAGAFACLAGHASTVAVASVPSTACLSIAVQRSAVQRRRARSAMELGSTALATAVERHARTHINTYAGGPDKRGVALSGGGVVAFRVSHGVAVTAGDPLDDQSRLARSITEFAALRTTCGWIPCFFQVDAALRNAYRSAGMRLVKFGEEALVDLASFTLATPARANLRREVGRARRAGLSVTLVPWSSITPQLLEELRAVSQAWLRGRGSEMGFSMGRLDDTVDNGALLTIVRDETGRVDAFSSWLRMGDDGLALDLVRRRSDAKRGAVDLCLAHTLEEAQRRGLQRASLGSVPFRDTLGDARDGRLTRWLRARMYRSRVRGYCFGSLGDFKQKFAPTWVSRDIAFPRGVAPLVLFALIRVHLTRSDATR